MKLFIRDVAWIRKGEGWGVWRITLYRTEETFPHNKQMATILMRCWFSAPPPPDFQLYFMFVTFLSCSIQMMTLFFLECLNRNYHNFLGIVEYVTDKMQNIYTDQSRTTSSRSHYRVRAIFFQRWWKKYCTDCFLIIFNSRRQEE